ncbi:MAG: CDP-diacylglycerol--serine O-phosphatidyltransferase [Ignavibacteriales bacterium CG12_big_fil_rev_8_21_14_0_65_30_8]|nr:MAG: CDP-diacylglycerol--serine O-phosphatidyltransferase [Ignavibacteriales bacterium CG12_big_fil_rev_8_21_14_0_65_30_8]
MIQIRVTRSVIPNLFTAMNMFCGFLSIVHTNQGDYTYAAWLIITAALFDALDGIVARLTHSSSKLGVQLDSLSDVVSFGVAPAFLIYSTYLNNYDNIGLIISALFMIAGGFRLARFNVQLVGFDKEFFYGLPIPLAAITISSLILTFYEPTFGFQENIKDVIIPLILILSLMMVTKIKYNSIPKISVDSIKHHPFQFIFYLIAGVLIVITSGKAFFYIFVFFIVFGIFQHLFNTIMLKK